jgi:CubicO group peptidase (beta-lactamase class C family)
MKKCIVFLTSIFILANLSGQNGFNPSLTEKYVAENKFNGSILVHKGDSIIYHENFGLANQEFNVPIIDTTKFKIASITKLFTSVLIFQLYEQGKVDLNESISTYLSNYSGEAANKVSVLQLLTSTSGIESMEKDGDIVYEKRYSTDEILKTYCNGKLVNEPGKKFNYNNADYVILGKILEEIYSQKFEQIVNEKILFPLDMNSTGLLNYELVNGLASSYWWNDSLKIAERDIPYYPENYYTSGGMYSTIFDLMKFSKALYRYELISRSTLDILLKPNLDSYACGLWVFDIPRDSKGKLTIAMRPGNIWGTESGLTRIVNKNTSIIILSNMMGTTDRIELEKKIINSLTL